MRPRFAEKTLVRPLSKTFRKTSAPDPAIGRVIRQAVALAMLATVLETALRLAHLHLNTLGFIGLNVLRFRVRGLAEGASALAVRRRLDWIWTLLLANSALWAVAVAWLLMVTPNESARTVASISSYAFATAFAHNFPMRLRSAFVALGLLYLSTLAALIANGSRFELVAVSVLYLLYVSLALRRSHAEYRQRLDLEDELREQRDLFERQSRRDGLTGLANRRRFSGALADWVAKARSGGSPLALLILDLDHFKSVNDRHGHAAGDTCLREFAEQLQQAFPAQGELVARLGGEEFGVLLRDCTSGEAARRAGLDLVGFAVGHRGVSAGAKDFPRLLAAAAPRGNAADRRGSWTRVAGGLAG